MSLLMEGATLAPIIDSKERLMKELVVVVAIVVAWYVLNRYVLPRLGVKT